MKLRQKSWALLSIGLFLVTAAAAQEATTEPALVAYLPATTGPILSTPASPAAVQARKEGKPVLVPILRYTFLSALKDAAAGFRSQPDQAANAAEPVFSFTLRKEAPSLALVSPLPRNLSLTTFPQSRLRGPFEQVYPRPW